jgi:hypothetical protein
MEKDLGLAVDIAAKMKCRVPLGSNAHQLYGMLSDHGYVSVFAARVFTTGAFVALLTIVLCTLLCLSYVGRDFSVVYEFLAQSKAK